MTERIGSIFQAADGAWVQVYHKDALNEGCLLCHFFRQEAGPEKRCEARKDTCYVTYRAVCRPEPGPDGRGFGGGEPSMGKKTGEIEALEAALKELETQLAKYKENPGFNMETDAYLRAYFDGYTNGMKGAIVTVQLEIGIRQDPPNVFYGLEKRPPKPGNEEG
jgi:hypothetical protein